MPSEYDMTAEKPSILRRIFAGLVLMLAVVVAFKLLVGMVMAVFWTLVTVVVVIAIVWALKTLLW